MDWRKKIALVILVVGAGLGVALQFRKHASSISETSSATSPQTSRAADSANQNAAEQNAAAGAATSFDGHFANKFSSDSSGEDASSSGAGAKSAMVDLNTPQQTHKIVDGDTLPQLSQQYLGRTDRYMEIFEYNRDVLSSPDVLPIGAELRIPSRLALPPSNGNFNSIASQATTPSGKKSTAQAAPLVPVASPLAKPASSQSNAAHTYTVKPGDNLVDIARKLYGDGRRNEDLFEANRRIMRNPGDLKPGMVLVVP